MFLQRLPLFFVLFGICFSDHPHGRSGHGHGRSGHGHSSKGKLEESSDVSDESGPLEVSNESVDLSYKLTGDSDEGLLLLDDDIIDPNEVDDKSSESSSSFETDIFYCNLKVEDRDKFAELSGSNQCRFSMVRFYLLYDLKLH